jgi:hypothetical protein
MNLKVSLPTGEVTVPVEPNSTPGHLKENLKYSLRVPPKQIRLTVNGRELDDLKQIAGEPNNVKDGDVVVAEPKDGAAVAEEEASKTSSKPVEHMPTMIRKEEPPKPKKIMKDVVRPTLADGDVVKNKTLRNGSTGWAPNKAYMEAKSAKRHLAFVKIEAGAAAGLAPEMKVKLHGLKAQPDLNGQEAVLVKFNEEKGRWETKIGSGKSGKMLEIKPDNLEAIDGGNKAYPEQGTLALALGDPHTSPVWTAAIQNLDIGEKAEFTISKKAVDFDPVGLNPTDSSKTWTVELVSVEEVTDLDEDFKQLIHIEAKGAPEVAQELDAAAVHWRVRRWMAEGAFCIASSRERIAIMPGYGLVPIEDQNAPPVTVAVGEGQQEAIEAIAARVGAGGRGHMYLKPEAMTSNRPQGCVIIDVELVALDPNRGPGTPGWQGWQSLFMEREKGDRWLEEADEVRKQLETFGTLQKSTGGTKGAEENAAKKVHKYGANALRRYRRALRWVAEENQEDKKIVQEKLTMKMRLAKALALSQQRFGEEADAEAGEEEKKTLQESQALLSEVQAAANEDVKKHEGLLYECLKMTLQVTIQAQEVENARKVLEELTTMRPDEADELKSDSARINRLEGALGLKSGAKKIETVQLDLRKAVEEKDNPKVTENLQTILAMLKESQVTWDTVRTLKVGKDVGNAMKMGDADIAAVARSCVGEIQALAQRNSIGL